jgi:hypothetical protein
VLLAAPVQGIALRYGQFYGPGTIKAEAQGQCPVCGGRSTRGPSRDREGAPWRLQCGRRQHSHRHGQGAPAARLGSCIPARPLG